jgi:hypothetical protein
MSVISKAPSVARTQRTPFCGRSAKVIKQAAEDPREDALMSRGAKIKTGQECPFLRIRDKKVGGRRPMAAR